ncbi:uncharacterized protein BP5553_04451 [Venustampulla echinocandica]|uniref:Roadblock/LAMTOR2 domain-containing protein n=1 Tax=Venustampulla echinocandica TaxID=2656787 RepID=A0A370TNC9_9HELO|nr:uncharacterized protein BP5553_04451 [Venustampulla echinocandica]RDL37018.1 hypothetical protein BP5553_04451 [Venustampulla echinocandica]
MRVRRWHYVLLLLTNAVRAIFTLQGCCFPDPTTNTPFRTSPSSSGLLEFTLLPSALPPTSPLLLAMQRATDLQGGVPSAVSETISRLAGKSGVKATMVLDRSLNTVLQTTGSFSSFRSLDAPRNTASASTTSDTNTANEEGVDEFAAMIWSFVNSAGGLVHNLDSEDDIKLLRLRTKKNELVIVPDPKYIFVVVHDTPPA